MSAGGAHAFNTCEITAITEGTLMNPGDRSARGIRTPTGVVYSHTGTTNAVRTKRPHPLVATADPQSSLPAAGTQCTGLDSIQLTDNVAPTGFEPAIS